MSDVLLSLHESQVIELVRQLSADGKRLVLKTLLPEWELFEELTDYGIERMHAVARERGVEWQSLTEPQREQFIDELLHERA
ncbi:MAG: hypothetical protein HUU23_04065 [Caldilineales bacterium]|nr:hypothetical protein [Caldilineales bacterium]